MDNPAAKRARSNSRAIVTAVACAALLSGCLDITARMTAEGSGDLQLVVSGIDAAQADRVLGALGSPHVKVLEHSFAGEKGRYHIAVADVEDLHTAPMFRNVRISRRRAGQRETLVITLPRNPLPAANDEKAQAKLKEVLFSLHLTVPGDIVETNADSHTGDTAQWTLKGRALTGKGEVGMKVVYDIPAPTPQPTPVTTPAASPQTAATAPTAAATPAP